MRKTVLTGLVVVAILGSCANNGEKAEIQEAKKVSVNEVKTSVLFNNITDGSQVDWRASHLGGVQKRFGKIYLKNAKFVVNNNELSNATVEMDMHSFTVENFPEDGEQTAKLTGHLKSDDFFKVEAYPTAKFELVDVQNATGDYSSKVTGNLTILDVTKSIAFNANITVADNEVSLKSEDFSIDRTQWGLIYNTEGTAGVPADYLISNDLGFTIDVTLSNE